MKPLDLIFTVHCHQPVGQSDERLRDAYNKAYLPFIETFEKYPTVKFAVYYSGIILEWFSKNHPEFIEKLKMLARRGQMEALSGGYYDPILSLITHEDCVQQIRRETDFIKKNFLRVPQGAWLTHSAWEPHLPKALSDSGIEYTLVNDHQMMQSGISEDDMRGYFITEEQGVTLKLFPINRPLNRLIPYSSPEETIDSLSAIAKERGGGLVVFADEGEKFGAVPGTNKWMYEDKWLDRFLGMLAQNKDLIRTMTLSEYVEEYPPAGRVYVPSSSSDAFNDATLTAEKKARYESVADEIRSFGKQDNYHEFLVKGGYYRNFLRKYPEANNLHKKMLYLSQKLEALEKGRLLGLSSKEREERIEEARINLMMGQCAINYFTVADDGASWDERRAALYEHLIKAEVLMDRLARETQKFIEAKTIDFDKDGFDEVLVSGSLANCYIAPNRGGSIFEIDHKSKYMNLLNVFSRYREDKGEEQIYDDHQKLSLLDHFLPVETTFEDYRLSAYKEAGDFIAAQYTPVIKSTSNEVDVRLKRKGAVFSGAEQSEIEIMKTITMISGQTQMNIDYVIKNVSMTAARNIFGVELNFAFDAQGYYLFDDITKAKFTSYGEAKNISSVKLIDETRGVSVSLETGNLSSVWRYPIESVHRKGEDIERRFHGVSVLLLKQVDIAPGGEWKTSIRLNFE